MCESEVALYTMLLAIDGLCGVVLHPLSDYGKTMNEGCE